MAIRKTIQQLTLLQVQTVAHELACELFDYAEPIPAFVTRFPNRLESCLSTPFQKWGGKSLYMGIVGKSAILFYLMIKNHPFQNGNKRVAVMTLLYFLHINGRWMKVSNDQLYLFAKQVATSEPANREVVMEAVRAFIRENIVERGNSK